jgi:ERCC4-type nuclease
VWFEKNGIEYTVQKLDVGDFMLPDNPKVSVDRKQNLSELSRNLTNKADHSRFWKEVRRAMEQGIKLYILCEHGGKIKSIQDVAQWHDKYSGVSGRHLMDEIYRTHIAYGVEFLFCDKRCTAQKIIQILTKENSNG